LGVLYEPSVSRLGKVTGKWVAFVVSAGSTEVKKKQPGTLQVTNDKPRIFTEAEWLAVQHCKYAIAQQHSTRFRMAQKDANSRVLSLTSGGSGRQETLAQKKAEEHKKQLEDTKAELAALKEKMRAKKSKGKLKNPQATNPHLAGSPQQQHFPQQQQQSLQQLQTVNPLSGEQGTAVLQPGQMYPQHHLFQPQPQQLLYQHQAHAQQQPFYQQQPFHHQQPIYQQQQPLHYQQPIYQQQPLYQQQPPQFYQEHQPLPQNFMHTAPQAPNMPHQQLHIQQPHLQLAQMEERLMRVLKTQQILSIMNQ
jgi:ribosomal protein L29